MAIEKEILLKDLVASTELHAREEADLCFDAVLIPPSAQKVVFDFTDVTYISRSFADQFHKNKVKLIEERSVVVDILNADIAVIKMLHAVSNSQHIKHRQVETMLPIYSFSNSDQLLQYLKTV